MAPSGPAASPQISTPSEQFSTMRRVSSSRAPLMSSSNIYPPERQMPPMMPQYSPMPYYGPQFYGMPPFMPQTGPVMPPAPTPQPKTASPDALIKVFCCT